MSRRADTRIRIREWLIAGMGISAFGLAAILWGYRPSPGLVRLSMTAGDEPGMRHRVALRLVSEARRRGIQIGLSPTVGSKAALDRVDSGQVEIALVQGGFDPDAWRDVRQVTALNIEPLHLLVKQEILAEVGRDLAALRGKVVNLGNKNSGTYDLAREVLEFSGLDLRKGDYEARDLGYGDLKQVEDRARLPDAVFTVSTLRSPVALHLVTAHNYRLVPLPFGEAFSLSASDEGRDDLPRPARDQSAGDRVTRVDRRHVIDATIPAFCYGVDPGVPPETIHTLGTRLLVVAHKGVAPKTIGRLLEVIYGTRFALISLPPLDAKMLDLQPEWEWHEGTIDYVERNKPLIAADVVDLLEKELSICGVVVTGVLFLGQWLWRRSRRRRERSFEAYILKVHAIEQRGMELELAASLDLRRLLPLQEELGRLKGDALERFAAGELAGEELMSGFLAHVSDTRDYLARLILHERDNLEDQAQRQGQRPQSLWIDAIGRTDGDAASLGP
jgi:TRAP-type uncharacterized transport system substrate-binding protein